MIPLPIALCVFDNSRGHFGRTDIYQRTITDLANQLPLEHFKLRFAHIKVQPGEEVVANQQRDFYLANRFEVIGTHGQWKHHDLSHQTEYCRDLITVYEQIPVLRCDFALHLESDWLFNTNGAELIDFVGEGISYLAATPQVCGVRFPRFQNEIERLRGLKAKHNMDVRVEREQAPYESFYRHNDNLSLNPGLFRTRDLYTATRLMKRDFTHFGQHVEMGFTHCLSFLSDGQLPYAIFDPEKVNALHIGTKAGEEDVAGNVYDK